MAPYCITMLLTPDYGERAKGKPEAPKAQTPYYCIRPKPCEQFTHSTQRVQNSPSVNKRTAAHRIPDHLAPRVQEGTSPDPSQGNSEVPGPSGSGPPTISILKPIRRHISVFPIRIDVLRCRATTGDDRSPILRVN